MVRGIVVAVRASTVHGTGVAALASALGGQALGRAAQASEAVVDLAIEGMIIGVLNRTLTSRISTEVPGLMAVAQAIGIGVEAE